MEQQSNIPGLDHPKLIKIIVITIVIVIEEARLELSKLQGQI